ncbi:LAFA_0F11826g1_1 [Lachancea sp. 'fantastica']|nr:LAFA_0F11826g1_1 [Lachancea sp. 'fantastica']
MSSMVYVCPSAYLASQGAEQWHSESFKPGFVPILRTSLLKFRDELDKVVSKVNQQKAAHAYQTSDGNATTAGEQEAASEKVGEVSEDSVLHKHQDLKQFLPITLEQQICTISVDGLPESLTRAQMAEFVSSLETLTAEKVGISNVLQNWSFFKGLNSTALLLRCNDSKQLPSVLALWVRIFTRWSELDDVVKPSVHQDENTMRFYNDHMKTTDEIPIAELDEQVTTLNNLLKKLKHSSSPSNEENVSVDYHVDVTTLSDLPRFSLEQLCKDIVHFRTRVVSIEKEKRAKAEYEENKRMGQHMKNVFDQIRKSKGDAKLAEDDDEPGILEDEEADDQEDDWVVETREQEKLQINTDRLFAELLDNLATRIEPRLQRLQQQLAHENNYEATLEKERPLYLKELLHLGYSPYYDHHRSFKDEEVRRDKENRDAYGAAEPLVEEAPEEEVPLVTEQGKFKLQIGKAKEEEKEAEDKLSQTGEDLDLLLQKLRDSNLVRDLALEYLGEADQDLEDYIFDHLKEHASRPELLAELRETFDEDADVIVARIWEKLESLSRGEI